MHRRVFGHVGEGTGQAVAVSDPKDRGHPDFGARRSDGDHSNGAAGANTRSLAEG